MKKYFNIIVTGLFLLISACSLDSPDSSPTVSTAVYIDLKELQFEVYYIGEWDDSDSPFIKEEQNLLNLIAGSLSEIIEHKHHEIRIP